MRFLHAMRRDAHSDGFAKEKGVSAVGDCLFRALVDNEATFAGSVAGALRRRSALSDAVGPARSTISRRQGCSRVLALGFAKKQKIVKRLTIVIQLCLG